MPNEKLGEKRCPHCGMRLDVDLKYTYQYRAWAIPSVVILISLMLFSLDYFACLTFTWSPWAVLGLWIIYIPIQLLREAPQFGWVVIPFMASAFSVFLLYLDRSTGENSGHYGFDWGPFAVIPIVTFFVILPMLAHFARQNYTEYDRLVDLIEILETEEGEK